MYSIYFAWFVRFVMLAKPVSVDLVQGGGGGDLEPFSYSFHSLIYHSTRIIQLGETDACSFLDLKKLPHPEACPEQIKGKVCTCFY